MTQSEPGQLGRQVDVGLRRAPLRLRVGVKDRRLLAAVLDRVVDPNLVAGVDHEPHRALVRIAGREVGGETLAGNGDHPAALIRRLVARVGDELVMQIA